jgi:hypothetical protein
MPAQWPKQRPRAGALPASPRADHHPLPKPIRTCGRVATGPGHRGVLGVQRITIRAVQVF